MTNVQAAVTFLFGEPNAPDVDRDEVLRIMFDDELDYFIELCEANGSKAKAERAIRKIRKRLSD
jgi:hypothetical protein